MRKETLAILACLGANIIWGCSSMFTKFTFQTAPVFVMLSTRFVLAFVILSLLVLVGVFKVNYRGKRMGRLFILGMIEPVGYFLFNIFGLTRTPTTFAGVLTALIPLVSTLFAALFLRERPGRRQVQFMLLSLAGVVIISLGESSSGTLSLVGTLLMLGSVCCGAGFSVLSRDLAQEFTPFERTYMMIGMAAVAFVGLGFLVEGPTLPVKCWDALQTPTYLVAILYLVLGSLIGSYMLLNYAVTYISAAQAVSFANLATVLTVLMGVLVLGESFTALQFFALAMIILGIVGVNYYFSAVPAMPKGMGSLPEAAAEDHNEPPRP